MSFEVTQYGDCPIAQRFVINLDQRTSQISGYFTEGAQPDTITAMLPWVILPQRGTDNATTQLQLFEPFSEPVRLKSHPAVITFVGWEDTQVSGSGICATTSDALEETVICNFLNLSRCNQFQPAPICAKHTFSVDTERTSELLLHLCLEFSDIICIKAKSIDDAIRTMIGFRDCIRSDSIPIETQFIVIIEEPSSQLGIGEKIIRDRFQSLVAEEDPRSQKMLNAVQRMIVRSHRAPIGSMSELLIDVKDTIIFLRERRKERGHLWNLEEMMFLVGEYLSMEISPTREHRIVPIKTFRTHATWYPMAFRRQFWPGKELLNCNSLTEWLRATPIHVDLETFVAPIFARMFLEDRTLLPRGFSNIELFTAIYGPLCRDAWQLAAQRDGWNPRQSLQCFLDAVALRMCIHNSTLERDAQKGLREVGEKTLCCLCPWDMAPFIYFPCGHGICERDAWRFSGITINNSYYSTLAYFRVCPVCGAPADLVKRLRPLQAGFRVATIDGGGVYGFIPHISFREIDKDLPGALSPHHYFDIIVGTSSGSITSVAWGIKQWPLSYCIKIFGLTATRVFVKKRGIKAQVKRWLRLYRVGAQYDIDQLGQVLRDHVGDVGMREIPLDTKECSVRVAITATTFDSKLCLYRSYGDVLCDEEYSDDVSQNLRNPLLWQAVATSCAAPTMFEPLRKTRKLDGVFVANCPASVAMMETNKLSLLDTRMLDFHVSFGTGRFLTSDQSCSRNWTKYVIPEWIRRVTFCVRTAIDADSMYEKFWNTLDKAEKSSKHYRIDPGITVRSLARDDPVALPDLEKETMRHMELQETTVRTQRLRLAMLASCFFCTLLSPPRYNSRLGRYCVRIAIQSRWPEDDAISQSLHEKLANASFLVDTLAYSYKYPLVCPIYVDELDVSIRIALTLDGEESHPISGFPLTLNQIMYLQLPSCAVRATSRKRGGSFSASRRSKRRCLEWTGLIKTWKFT